MAEVACVEHKRDADGHREFLLDHDPPAPRRFRRESHQKKVNLGEV
jgi:hypothetical protein